MLETLRQLRQTENSPQRIQCIVSETNVAFKMACIRFHLIYVYNLWYKSSYTIHGHLYIVRLFVAFSTLRTFPAHLNPCHCPDSIVHSTSMLITSNAPFSIQIHSVNWLFRYETFRRQTMQSKQTKELLMSLLKSYDIFAALFFFHRWR